jgi:hypothetical protein
MHYDVGNASTHLNPRKPPVKYDFLNPSQLRQKSHLSNPPASVEPPSEMKESFCLKISGRPERGGQKENFNNRKNALYMFIHRSLSLPISVHNMQPSSPLAETLANSKWPEFDRVSGLCMSLA